MRRYYLYFFLNGLQFTWTTWLAYVVAHGGNPGYAEGAYHLAILLGEVPTGAVADLMGRRKSMIVGLVLSAIGPLGYFFIHDTLTACLVLAFSGLAGTFLSGADTALFYETAAEQGGADFARQAMARATAITMAASALAPAMAGFLYQWNDLAPFLGKSLVSLVTLAVVLGLKERMAVQPLVERNRTSVWRQTWSAIQVLRHDRTALALIAFGWVYNMGGAMTNQYAQAYFPFLGLAMGLVGLTFAAGQVLSTGASALAERMRPAVAARWLRFAPTAVGALFLGMGVAGRWAGGALVAPGLVSAGAVAAVACFVLAQGGDGVIYPLYQARFNEQIPSAHRATLLSLQSAGFSLLMTVSFPAASYLAMPSIYLVNGAVAVLLGVLWMLRRGA